MILARYRCPAWPDARRGRGDESYRAIVLGMETTRAPDLTEGYPSKGAKIGPAWAEAWALLSRYPGEFRDGQELWTTIAPRHDLHPDTLRGLMFRMVKGHWLVSETRQVITERGKRTRTFFRVGSGPAQ